MNWLSDLVFNRSSHFLRTFDALCAAVFALLFWRTDDWVWAASAAVSALLCVTGATMRIQSAVQRLLRGGALALTIRKGA